jgi:hypothetical protein
MTGAAASSRTATLPPDADRLPGLDPGDVRRLRRTVALAAQGGFHRALRWMVPGSGHDEALADLERTCAVGHAGVLVFPDTVDALLAALRELGSTPGRLLPSTVVRARLARRYLLAPDDLPVSIVHARGKVPGDWEIEVFLIERGLPGLPDDLIRRERAEESETHLALDVLRPSGSELARLAGLFDSLGLRPDGGGFNPYESADKGGRSVLYFSASPDTIPPVPGIHRLELTCVGHHPDVITSHLDLTMRSKA